MEFVTPILICNYKREDHDLYQANTIPEMQGKKQMHLKYINVSIRNVVLTCLVHDKLRYETRKCHCGAFKYDMIWQVA